VSGRIPGLQLECDAVVLQGFQQSPLEAECCCQPPARDRAVRSAFPLSRGSESWRCAG
jgi:hypothetical protein